MFEWATDPAVWAHVAELVAGALMIIVPLMLTVAYYTYAERKVIGFMQMRLGPSRVGPRGLLQEARLLVEGDGLDQRVELAVEDAREAVPGEPHAVVGHAVVGEVVGADLLRAVAAAHLRAARVGDLGVGFGALQFVEAGAQHALRLGAVLGLRALVLADDDDAGRLVREAHGGGDLVDVLPAGAGGVEDVRAHLGPVDLHLHLVDLGEDGDGGGGGVDAALRLGFGDALDAVDAGLVLHAPVGVLAADAERDLAVAAGAGLGGVEHLQPPALALGVALVHAEQVGGEQRGLVAAGAAADLDDRVLLVGGVARQEGDLQLLLEPREQRREPLLLLAPELALLLVARAQQVARVVQRLPRVAEAPSQLDDGFEVRPLARDLRHAPVVGGHVGVPEARGQLLEPRFDLGDAFEHVARVAASARAGARPARGASRFRANPLSAPPLIPSPLLVGEGQGEGDKQHARGRSPAPCSDRRSLTQRPARRLRSEAPSPRRGPRRARRPLTPRPLPQRGEGARGEHATRTFPSALIPSRWRELG